MRTLFRGVLREKKITRQLRRYVNGIAIAWVFMSWRCSPAAPLPGMGGGGEWAAFRGAPPTRCTRTHCLPPRLSCWSADRYALASSNLSWPLNWQKSGHATYNASWDLYGGSLIAVRSLISSMLTIDVVFRNY